MQSGAELIMSALKAEGVDRIFGIPGVQNLELFDALQDSGIETVLVTHELCAAFMAEATSRITGKAGCALTVPGPGLTNAFTGIGEALLDSSPVVVIIPGPRNDTTFKYQLHQMPQAELARPITKAAIRVEKADEIYPEIRRAFEIATSGEPGPVVVEVPYNLFMWRAEQRQPAPRAATAPPDPQTIEKILRLLRAAKRVGIYAGFGASDARDQLMRLAELLQAPIATTLGGRGVVPEDFAYSVGFGFGASGTAIAEEVFAECDLVLAVACKFGEVATGAYGFPRPKQLIHIDINPEVVGRNMPATIGLVADAQAALGCLAAALDQDSEMRSSPPDPQLINRIEAWRSEFAARVESEPAWESSVNPAKLMWTLRKLAARDAIITTDSGGHQFWVAEYFPVYERRSYLTPTDYQSMGYSVPAMIAAKLACPSRQVIGVVGDGSFLMTGAELVTAARLGLDPVVIIFNDGELGIIREAQEKIFRRTSAIKLRNPDFEALARAYGANYFLIANDGEIELKLRAALASGSLAVVDARVEYREMTRYFKGASSAVVGRMPLAQKARMAVRLVRRWL
ncbi:MAG: thiamine pyrophosphate-binding protein [Terriglobia bacterium]